MGQGKWFTWVIDDPGDKVAIVMIAIVFALLVFGIVFLLYLLLKTKKVKVSKDGAEMSDEGETKGDVLQAPEDCIEHPVFEEEHLEILNELKENNKLLTRLIQNQGEDIRAIFFTLNPVLSGIKTAVEAANGEINGNIKESLKLIEEGQRLFDEHLMNKIGRRPT